MTAAAARVSLYDLGEAQDILDAFLREAEGEETPELAELWDLLAGQVDEKIERWGLWLRGQQLQADLIKAEEERLRQRRRTIENALERSKAALHANMTRLGRTKVQGQLITVVLAKNPPSVKGELDDNAIRTLAVIDPELVTHVPESFTLNKRAVIEAHKAGKMLPAGITVEQGESLRIR